MTRVDLFRFFYSNLRHYALALWGIRLQLEPDYPVVTRVVPHLIRDSVYEYRTYGPMLLWSIGAVVWLPRWLLVALLVFWAFQSFRRAGYFRSNFLFWKQAYRESPRKSRCQTFYVEWIIREVERLYKAGNVDRERIADMEAEAFQIQNWICGRVAYICGACLRPWPPGVSIYECLNCGRAGTRTEVK